MIFPKDKMELTESFNGREAQNGWLVLNISKTDIEGVNKIYINLDDLEQLRLESASRKSALQRAKELLGG